MSRTILADFCTIMALDGWLSFVLIRDKRGGRVVSGLDHAWGTDQKCYAGVASQDESFQSRFML